MKKILSVFLAISFSLFASAQLPNINLIQLATGFTSPIGLYNCGDNRLFVVEQAGNIRIMDKSGNIRATPFLALDSVKSSGNEQGLLGVAFSPNYKQDGYFYVNYIFNNGTSAGVTRISRFSVNATDSNLADANTEKVILAFNQPYNNHNGASLMFGHDGYLYDSQGDGGSEYDPTPPNPTGGYGQNLNYYLSKLLRLDVSNPDTTYTIPPSNPFIGVPNTKPETWAWGLRNPWRCSIDRITGDIWIGDVGQDNYEEVDFQSASSTGGENYGWRCREGFHPCPTTNLTGCASTGFTDPIFEYAHISGNCSISGGYVYRGTQYQLLFGRYLFADYCSGRIWRTTKTGNNTFVTDSPTVYVNGIHQYLTNNITSFGQDNLGELYVCYRGSGTGGRIYKLTETTDCNPNAFISLQDTIQGCSPVTISALQGDTLSYQWYNSNGIINGATTYQYPVSQSGWYKVNVSKTLHAGCEAMSDSVYVNLHDTTALILCNCVTPFCNNDSGPYPMAGYVSPVGGVYSGTGVSNNQFIPLHQSAGVHNISYLYTNNYECVSRFSFPFTINDTTALTVTTGNLQYCADDSAVSLSGIVLPKGGTYYSSYVTNDTVFNPALLGAGSIDIPYAYIDNNNCSSVVDLNYEVGRASVLTRLVPPDDYCLNANPFPLDSFVVPAGGTYTGNGVSNNIFSPAAAGVGMATVYYDYTNSYGCNSRDTLTWMVDACLGIKEVSQNLSFNIFPNPAKGSFNIQVKVNSIQHSELTLTDAIGKVCFRKNLLLDPNKPNIFIELPSFAKGVYTVALRSEKESAVRNLVIQ